MKNYGFVQWLIAIVGWILGHRRRYSRSAPKILREFHSEYSRVIELDRNSARAVSTWKCIPVESNAAEDWMLICDHLRVVPGESSGLFRGVSPIATHRISIFKIPRYRKQDQEIDLYFLGDFDLVPIFSPLADDDRYARAISERMARTFLVIPHEFIQNIHWLDVLDKLAREYLGEKHNNEGRDVFERSNVEPRKNPGVKQPRGDSRNGF